MAERITSDAQLARILEIIPRAAREGGVSVRDLAGALDMDEHAVLRDLAEVCTRIHYHPAGTGEDVQVLIETDQVEVWTTGEFRRPIRLNSQEALSLGLGLRVLAAESPEPSRRGMLGLAERLEKRIASASPELLPHVAIDAGRAPSEVRSMLADAARERRRCRITYLKPASPGPEIRDVEPYVLAVAEGTWFVVGRCCRSGEARIFRVDRMLDVAVLAEGFQVPASFEVDDYITDGRVYRASEEVEVTVRYSSRIARWIAEQGPVETLDDGSVVVRYRVADSGWLIRHVLEHGIDAEVIAPPEVRHDLRAAVARMCLASR